MTRRAGNAITCSTASAFLHASRRLVLLVLASVATLIAVPAVAEAASVSWTLPGMADASAAVPFRWSAHPKPGSRLVVQRQEGTARFWRTVLGLPGSPSGSASLPGLPLGTYQLRIADIGQRGAVLAQQPRALQVFGDVPFSTLFNANVEHQAVVGFNGNTGPGTATTPTQTIQYACGGVAGVGNPAVTVTDNNCRSIHFDFLPTLPEEGVPSNYVGATGTITVVQQTLDPVSATAPLDSGGSLDAALVPGQSWSMNSSASLPQPGEDSFYIYVNGYASCDSSVPFTSG